MNIITKQFGEVNFNAENLISFNNGIFGFENYKNFLLIKTEDELFFWLNSIDNSEIAFPMIGIRIIDENYPEEPGFEAFSIVTLDKNPLNITVNLKAPVYLDQDSKTGFQKIIDLEKYPVNYTLFIE